ncbi:cytochrome P450 [Actinokineospora sp. NPDC004072]
MEPQAYPFNQDEGLELDPAYRTLRETPGMIRVRLPYGEPAWLATRYEDARMVLGDRRFSRAMGATRDEPRPHEGRRPTGILGMDPPDHTRLRKLVATAFTVRRVEALRPRVREITAGLVDAMVEAGPPVDLVEAFALPLPVQVICEMLGVPVEDRDRFRVWSDAALSTSSLTAEEFLDNFVQMSEYMADLVALRTAEPKDDLISALIAAREQDVERLSADELVQLCNGILIAGHETTATQIPNFVHVLLAHDRWAELGEHPDRIPGAVEELLRYIPLGVGGAFPRYATEDVEVGGQLVRAGEPVLVAVGSANRDQTRFADPETLHFDRPQNSHMGFGHGAHHCLGAPLARLELQEAMRELTARLPGLHVVGEPRWKTAMLVRGPRSMVVSW